MRRRRDPTCGRRWGPAPGVLLTIAALGFVWFALTGPDDVAEHRARLDRRELPRIPDEDEPGVRPHGLDEPRHERQRHHRGLVHDHDVVRQPVQPVVAEAALAVGPPAEQAVQRRRSQREQLRPHRLGDREAPGLLVHGLL